MKHIHAIWGAAAVLALALGISAMAHDHGGTAIPAVERTPSPEGAAVYFINLADGDEVESPVLIQFGLRGMGIAPAGVEWEDTGHHHLLVNADLPPFDQFIPTDDNHLHFGNGQTETTLDLEPGTYRLRLLFADWLHLPHDPPVYSDEITITVK
jgi:hypothetical protein